MLNNPDYAEVAQAMLVHRANASFREASHPVEADVPDADDEQQPGTSSRPEIPEIVSLAPEYSEFVHLKIPQDCKYILAKARADSTIRTYQLKWKNIFSWCSSAKMHLMPPLQSKFSLICYI